MRKFIQKIIKYRKTSVSTIFVDKIITEEWILFSRFRILKVIRKA